MVEQLIIDPAGNPVEVDPETKTNFGVSGTNPLNLSQGALAALGGSGNVQAAVELAQSLMPKKEKFDPAMAALLYFTKMGELASKPGATLLGSASAAAASPAAYLMQQSKDERGRKSKLAPLTVQLATALKGKTGAPKNVELGPALDAGGIVKLDPTSKEPLFRFGIYKADGSLERTYEATRKGGGVNVSVGGEKKFGETFATKEATKFSTQLEGSQASADSLVTIRTLSNILRNPDFETGVWEQAKLPLKQLAVSFGVGDQKTIDSVASAEAFRAKAQELVLASVAKMKGALSDKELGFLESQNVSLGKSKEGNLLLLLLSEQQLEKSSGFASFRLDWEESKGDIKTSRDYARMIGDFRKSTPMQENPHQYVMRKVKQDLRQRLEEAGAKFDDQGGIVEGTISSELQSKFASEMSSKYNLPLVKKVFNNSGFSR